MKSILIIGKNGQVGSALGNALRPLGDITTVGRGELNLLDHGAIRAIIRASKPDIIVNAAAYTAVDKAESEPELAMQVNAIAPGIMAEEADRVGATLIHYSTDYVFDGRKDGPYVEADTPNPLSVYGRTKLAGELAIQATGASHYILRTSWVYAPNGANFVNTILRLAKEREELRIVDDQVGAPTSARSIADMTAQLLSHAKADEQDPGYGVYHLTASGAVTWFGFAQAILTAAEGKFLMKIPKLTPISTAEYPLPAMRPANSRLDTGKVTRTFGIKPDQWQHLLADFFQSAHGNGH